MDSRTVFQAAMRTAVLTVCLCAPGYAANFIVTHTQDAGPGSLREAIMLSNSNEGPDSILFHIPKSDPSFQESMTFWTIRPVQTPWPSIGGTGLVIDGFSQSRFIGEDTNPFGPEIELDGRNLQGQDGLAAYYGSAEIFGMTINRFRTGIYFGYMGDGKIGGCYVGTDPTGMRAEPNTMDGILLLETSHVAVVEHGGLKNVISGNQRIGVFIADSSNGNVVTNCIVGLNRTQTDTLPNGVGIEIARGSDGNVIAENTVSGNLGFGIDIAQSFRNLIGMNRIGTNDSFAAGFGNGDIGVLIWFGACRNVIGNNFIANNYSGVVIGDSTCHENKISYNSISRHTAKGIDNGYGGNRGIVPPVMTGISSDRVYGTAGPNQVIEVFADDADEGRILVGSDTAGASGDFSVAVAVPLQLPNLTATATDEDGNTSEFSVPFAVGTGMDRIGVAPAEFSLEPNYPNPFNPQTRIVFRVGAACRVELKILDVRGREMATLVDVRCDAGSHSVLFDASLLPSGIYLARIRMGGYEATRRMVKLD